jgi:hypothetical protein
MNIKNIQPGRGLGELLFGMNREEVLALLGEPTEKETYPLDEEECDEEVESWHYDELDLSLSFNEEDDYRLITIAVSGGDYLYNGVDPIGLDAAALETLLTDSKIEDLEKVEEEGLLLFSSETIGINFWFEEGKLSEVQWGPFFADEETIDWPA